MLELTVIGNVGQQAVVREVNGNKSINFSVAENRKYTDKNGVITEQTTWVNCTIWRHGQQSAEVAKFLLPGTRVFARGIPEIDLYEDKDKKTRASLKLNVQTLQLLSSKSSEEAEEEEAEESHEPQPKNNKKAPAPIL